MRGQFVALGFEPGAVGGEVNALLIPSRALLIERCIDLGGEMPVFVLADRDVAVGVLYQSFGDLDWDGAAGAGGLLRGASGADEVGLGGAAGVGCEVERHPRPATVAVQQAFQVVSVLHVPRPPRVARLQQRLHLIKLHGFGQRFMRAGMQRALVADPPA